MLQELFSFLFFYTSIVFNPKETAENLRKYGGYIPGIRPGERTAEYIETILIRLTTVGALYLTFVCLMPEFLIAKYHSILFRRNFHFDCSSCRHGYSDTSSN